MRKLETHGRIRGISMCLIFVNRGGIKWIEYPNNGVVRRLGNRDDWKRERDKRMRDSLSSPPIFKECIPFDGTVPALEDIGYS